MFNQLTLRISLLLAFLFAFNSNVFAQPILPDLASVTENGINVITWDCQFEGVKSIAVLRSNDSNFNFITIGYVKNIKKGVQYYLDGHPKAGTNWYKLNIVFGSNLAWTSNRIKIKVDSAQIAKGKVLPSNDSLQYLATKFRTKTIDLSTDTATVAKGSNPNAPKIDVVVTTSSTVTTPKVDSAAIKPKPVLKIPDIGQVDAYSYIKSQYVFTNPFTGHVNVEIADVAKYKYSIDFFDAANVKVLDIPRISEPSVIIDKRNFQRTGMYRFDLMKDKVKIETGYVTIY